MLNRQKNFSVVCLGCKVNRAEVDSYSARLIDKGWTLTDVNNSNLVIVNTCTVTAVAEKKTRQAIRKVCKETSADKIIVTGCASAIDPQFYAGIDKRIEVVAKCDMKCASAKSLKLLNGNEFRSRAALKIQDGCNNSCTYCIVHTARGKAWSMPHTQVEEQVASMLDAGIFEIVLSGVDIGAYNDGIFSLEDLCESLLGIIGNRNARIRISSIEPNNVSDRLIEILASANGKICRHLHIPLQSGSSKVLHEMARHYDTRKYFEIVNKLKTKIPQVALSTDIIVGFPGETDKEFQESLDLAKKCGFMKIHVFPYSIRQKTPAALRKDQVPEEIKSKRAAKLRQLSVLLAKKDLEGRKGQVEQVLVESDGHGRSESYHLIDVPTNAIAGDLIRLEL